VLCAIGGTRHSCATGGRTEVGWFLYCGVKFNVGVKYAALMAGLQGVHGELGVDEGTQRKWKSGKEDAPKRVMR
jgi:hypothetical protein